MRVEYTDNHGLPDLRRSLPGGRLAVVSGLLDDEPVFVFRARDAAAMAVLNLYRSMTEGLFEGERALSIEADVQAFIDWRHSPAGQAALRDPD